MKVVDEKGKLFKKFNLVDAIVVVLIVAIIVAIGVKAITKKLAANAAEMTEEEVLAYESSPHLAYKVVCIAIPEEVAKKIEAQMELPMSKRQMMSNGVPVEGYITNCRIEPHTDDDLYSVYYDLEAALVDKDGIYSVGSQEVRVGKSHIVKTYNIETSGYIYDMEVTGEVAANE